MVFRLRLTFGSEESRTVICTVVEDALKKAGVKPKQIDFVVVNCSLFNPTPSLAGMIEHHFKLRPDVRSYNIGGTLNSKLISFAP